jgi:hypothetical protein
MKSTLIRAIFVLAAAALIAVFLIRWQGGNDAPARPSSSTRPASTTPTLSIGSGRGNEVSSDFTVPRNCARQELSYRGTQTEGRGGFINFRVYDDTGFPAGSVGPVDLDEEQAGAALWTLDAGTTYSIEVTADGAEWSYTLKCR